MHRDAKEIESETVAFINVGLIAMEVEGVRDAQTVLVSGQRITAVGSTGTVEIPAGATVIDGTGAYLIPGLANMHAHLYEYDPDPRHLMLYVANGVTTVRALNSRKEIFTWKENVADGTWSGPTIFLSGPAIVGFPDDFRLLALGLKAGVLLGIILAGMLIFGALLALLALVDGSELAMDVARRWIGPWFALALVVAVFTVWRKLIPLTAFAARFVPQAAVVETPRQARAAVEKQVRAGVDFIKPYDYLDRKTYFAALAAAQENDVYTAGHIPEDPQFIRVEEALAAGLKEIAHVDEMTHEFLIGFDPRDSTRLDWEIAGERIDEIAATVAKHQAAVTATLVTNETVLLGLEDMDMLLSKPKYRVVKDEKIQQWREKGRMVNWKGQQTYRRGKLRPLWMQLTKALHDQGVPVLLGTDSDVEGIIPGVSEHDELALLVEAGLSPFEALAAGTRDAAMIAGRMKVDDRWGTIRVGHFADLVLLAANPLQDIANTRSIIGVMVHGRWLPKAELDRRAAEYLAVGR
ncbi:MAG: amidohydrolase family protein [Candidatus Promineifilaceae bacterium]|nr:amidohydrolase family protein [Candidatus Promineifilaceae bacterium]